MTSFAGIVIFFILYTLYGLVGIATCFTIYSYTNSELLSVIPLFLSVPIAFGPFWDFTSWVIDTFEKIEANYRYYRNKKYRICTYLFTIQLKWNHLESPCDCPWPYQSYTVKYIYGKKRKRFAPIVAKAIIQCDHCKKKKTITFKGKKLYADDFD